MDVKFLKKDGFAYKFLVLKTRYDVINAIRRAIIRDVLTVAIDKVLIYKNQSVMPDEFLAHRLGLIPVNSRDLDIQGESLYIKKTGGMVKSSDIDSASDVALPYQNIPIVLLNNNKDLEVEMVLRAGTGSEHIKWSPALVYYHGVPLITQKGNVDKSILDDAPNGVADVKSGKLVLTDPYDTDTAAYFESVSNGAIQVDYSDTDYVFAIEPYQNLDLDLIVSGASSSIISRLEMIKKDIASSKK